MEKHQFIKKGSREEERKKGTAKKQLIRLITINKMAFVSPYLSIMTLNINGLNSLMKRRRVPGWIKEDPTICFL